MAERNLEEKENGVLLYYKYTSVTDVKQLSDFYESNCKSLDLLGRVRIAPDGVNVTVGGKLSSLKKHIAAVKSNDLFEDTDFKLASCSSPSNDRIAKECGFESLSIRVVKELVTFSSHPLSKSSAISNAGRHLSAVEFDTVLHSAGTSLERCGIGQHKGLLLLDARNVYETRIGRFHTSNVETLDPGIRQYSDLPTWIDNHSEQLRGNNILMYCTGGIRCEMASAYIKSKGAGFENVFQLYGGIQRYLETFPDGGFFRGKNFVFDHRISVGSSNAETIGSCLLCASPFDDYSPRCRCTYCRMLVLVCGNCQGKNDAKYICELCQKHGKQDGPVLLIEGTSCRTESTPVGGSSHVELDSSIFNVNTTFPELSLNQGIGTSRKLRILCLHGFRQNASGFKGRTASLAKKLKNIVELVFINAPHELPFIYRPRPTESNHTSPEPPSEQTPPPSKHCNKKYAWLVTKEFDKSYGTDWLLVNEPFDPLQYRQQTDGHDVSLAYLKSVLTEMGPFDGILGFSQGAAMAASLCAEQGKSSGEIKFKFAILCSGFVLDLDHLEPESVHCPSLHIYGSGKGKDRQIACQTSMELSRVFKKNSSMIIEHESGHIIPTQSPYIDRIKDFLSGFM